MNTDETTLQYIRRLIFALTASGALNIVLISIFFYWLVKDTTPTPYFEQKPALKQEQQMPLASESGNAELIRYFRSLTFDQLVAKLSNSQLIENGYAQRDIALACLVAFHHLDLERAFIGQSQPQQQRSIVYGQLKRGEPASIVVYPGLSDLQFQAILDFVGTERWPLTSKGLFWKLKKLGNKADISLMDAFSMTQEFLTAEMLFNRADVPIKKSELQEMLLDGPWAILSEFAAQQKLGQDLSPANRQHFLLEYLNLKSKAAAYLMLQVDNEFALKKLDDRHVIELLRLLNEKTTESQKYALDLLTSPRGDSVWKAAAEKLYQYAGETVPEKNLHHLALSRFGLSPKAVKVIADEKLVQQKILSKPIVTKPNIVTKPITPPKAPAKIITTKPQPLPRAKKDRLYIVQEGDSLWKISRRFNIDMDTLRNYNKLSSDALKPGTPLRIP